MPVLSKALGDEVRAKCEKGQNPYKKDAEDPKQVLGISESIHIRIRRMHAGSQTVEKRSEHSA